MMPVLVSMTRAGVHKLPFSLIRAQRSEQYLRHYARHQPTGGESSDTLVGTQVRRAGRGQAVLGSPRWCLGLTRRIFVVIRSHRLRGGLLVAIVSVRPEQYRLAEFMRASM